MRILVWGVLTMLVLLFSGCARNKTEKKTKEKEWASPATSMSNRNDRFEAGKLVYDRNCKICHQANRMGIEKIYPPLKNTKRVTGDKEYLIDVVLNGMSEEIVVEGVKYKGVMASYRNLTDQQIADVINYIRSDSKAASAMVSAGEVKQMR
ncbi:MULTISPECIES: c-type cytochrome [unclassified Saccharicrinis]|uniref:c-type cytochrome n=1 Tax=unclassified Saccharicrinis TaxID=2646859 RepID=UPI003D35011F